MTWTIALIITTASWLTCSFLGLVLCYKRNGEILVWDVTAATAFGPLYMLAAASQLEFWDNVIFRRKK